MKQEQKHWFSFTFSEVQDSSQVIASTYTGYDCKNLNMNRINENKGYAHLSQSAVLMGVSYLGYMSKDEFEVANNQQT